MSERQPGRKLNARERALVAKHLPFVHKVALRVARRLPANVDIDDLVSAGSIGLMEAAVAFDRKRKVDFEAFAEFRVRGAMLDDLRARDTLSRDMRNLAKRLRYTAAVLEAKLGRAPSNLELATRLGIGIEEFYARQKKLSGSTVVGIDDAGPSLLERTPDSGAIDPTDYVERMELIAQLEAAARKLPTRTRAALALRYRDGWNMKEIGVAMGVTESRVCQIMKEAHVLMRGALGKNFEVS